MVQSLVAPDGEVQFDQLVNYLCFNIYCNLMNMSEHIKQTKINKKNSILQWKDVSPEQLMDSKLRCVFDMPADKTAASSINGLCFIQN